MTTNFRGKIHQLADIPSFVALVFRNGSQYRNDDWRVNSTMNWPTQCKKLVRFGAVTPEFTLITCVQEA